VIVHPIIHRDLEVGTDTLCEYNPSVFQTPLTIIPSDSESELHLKLESSPRIHEQDLLTRPPPYVLRKPASPASFSTWLLPVMVICAVVMAKCAVVVVMCAVGIRLEGTKFRLRHIARGISASPGSAALLGPEVPRSTLRLWITTRATDRAAKLIEAWLVSCPSHAERREVLRDERPQRRQTRAGQGGSKLAERPAR